METLDILLETYLFFSPLRDFKPLHYCCSLHMMQVWFCWTHKVANFPSSTVLPAAYVGVGSRFAIITAASSRQCKGTRRAEKLECEDFLSPHAKSVTLIWKPVKPLFSWQHIWFPAPAGECSPHRFRLGSFCVFKGFQTTPPLLLSPHPPWLRVALRADLLQTTCGVCLWRYWLYIHPAYSSRASLRG